MMIDLTASIGEEVENPESTVCGLVYRIEIRADGIWYKFMDEHYTTYSMKHVQLSHWLDFEEKQQILEHPHFKGGKYV